MLTKQPAGERTGTGSCSEYLLRCASICVLIGARPVICELMQTFFRTFRDSRPSSLIESAKAQRSRTVTVWQLMSSQTYSKGGINNVPSSIYTVECIYKRLQAASKRDLSQQRLQLLCSSCNSSSSNVLPLRTGPARVAYCVLGVRTTSRTYWRTDTLCCQAGSTRFRKKQQVSNKGRGWCALHAYANASYKPA
jgi:hypothetical protein